MLGYNDLGMHCMNDDFSEIMVLPPFNTLHAQVIQRRAEEPRVVESGLTVEYEIPGNTTSVTKTNFWEHVSALLGVALPPDIGLTGNSLSGNMAPTGENDWAATGIPVTPLMDDFSLNPYPLAMIAVSRLGEVVATTEAVVPVSWEMSCNLCHDEPGITTATDILQDHDRLHGTDLESNKPVFCGGCHAQEPLGTTQGESLSRAMHHAHASRMAAIDADVACYACHPGFETQCLRGVHYSEGLTCEDCHGDMNAVASPTRRPWIDEPRCGSCHQREEFEFEQPGTLYRDSKGHGGVHCAACHGSPHAVAPTVVAADNAQAVALQGHAGTISKCTVCHTAYPGEPFEHEYDGDDEQDDKSFPTTM